MKPIIPQNASLVFIALNPTEEAIKNGAVFSTSKAFWNVLINAGILSADINQVALVERANRVFQNQEFILNGLILGFADLVHNCFEKQSKNVNVTNIYVKKLTEILIEKEVTNIALLGQKVVDAFSKMHDNLYNWKNKPGFGEIGVIQNSISVYAMPFPVNNNIPNKGNIYNLLVPDN